MPDTPPKWQPHDHPDYDQIIGPESRNELNRLRNATNEERLQFMLDPREVHFRLYSPFCPPEYSEYAGTYRGTENTSLEHRLLRPPILGEGKGVSEFIPPNKISEHLPSLQEQAQKISEVVKGQSVNLQFGEAARLFYIFGLIHPFLDGNGHIQRLMFAAAVMQYDAIQLKDSWTIHPRPYDIEMAEAFNGDNRMQEVTNILTGYVTVKS